MQQIDTMTHFCWLFTNQTLQTCFNCQFRGFPRPADITLADFEIENVDKTMDQDLGTSLIIINSKKGKEYYESLGDAIVSKNLL